nr:hypothetical protein [Pseudomonas putida]HDS1006277.1 hypothetical protein [Pseudomonas putida]
MLVTKRADLQGQFLASDHLRLLWDSASLNADSYYFLVEGSGFVDGCLGPSMRIVSSVEVVDSLCKGDSVDFLSVNKVQLLAPPAMTNQTEFTMRLLSEIRIKDGTEATPIYEFVTHDGQVFSSARG